MSPGYLPTEFVARYSRPPSQTTTEQAVSIHRNVRELLGDSEYATLLQGSYKNDTALWDMNDVDIVAVARNVQSGTFSGTSTTNQISWSEIFDRIERLLQRDSRYQGKWTRKDKCIRLHTGVNVDIVPAVRIDDPDSDPIAIHSFELSREIKNWPRGHYEAAARKSRSTNGNFKQVVRLLKRWTRCWLGTRRVAPSYYVECLVYSQPDASLSGDVASAFVSTAANVSKMRYQSSVLHRLAGDGDLLTSQEWRSGDFQEFQRVLQQAEQHARAALAAHSEAQARNHWIAAFNGQQPQ